MNIAGSFFNASTGSPFAGYPAGTRFHLSGSSPIIFSGLPVQPPMGSVILMDGGKDLYVQDGASLDLSDVSITAACDDMWGRLWVRNTAAGISSTFTDGATGTPFGGSATNTYGATTLKNQLSHSLGGIEFEQSNVNGPVPYYKLTFFDFLHNEQSVKLWRANNASSGSNSDYVTYSVFDSTPESFKAPKFFVSTDPNYPHYSTYHVWFDGNGGGGWYSNSFRNSLFGFHNPTSTNAATLYLEDNNFDNVWLTSLNINSDNPNGQVYINGESRISGSPSTCLFPTALSLPTTPQFTAALANDVQDHLPETRGIFSNTFMVCYYMSFIQTVDPYTDYTFSERTKQIGIKALRLYRSSHNSFTLLHTGIQLSNVLLPTATRPNSPVINLSVFTSCRRGIEVHGAGQANKGGSATPPPASVSLLLTCNTFDRGDATRSGTAYGVYLASDARVTFDPLPVAASAPTLSNKFLDYNTGISGFYALYNGSLVPGFNVQYTTYADYLVSSPRISPGHHNLVDICTSSVNLLGNLNYIGLPHQSTLPDKVSFLGCFRILILFLEAEQTIA